MSRTTNRDIAARDPGQDQDSVDQKLARVLDTTLLARVVPHLAPETLHQLVRYRGLDACGEVLVSATPAQLNALLDLDLWRHPQPGRDERFDLDRFGEWLEALVDAGDAPAARIVAALDQGLVVAGLSRYVRVLDPGIFEPVAQSDDEAIDRHDMMHSETGADVLECEVGGYLIRARRSDAWDAIVTLLVTLDAAHREHFVALMQACRGLSNSRPEVDGLDDLLMTPEQYLHDVTIERQRRRARRGYATPAEARAFLQMARRPRVPPGKAATAVNPISAAYFRAAEEEEDTPAESTASGAPAQASHPEATDVGGRGGDISASVEAVIDLLAEAGLAPEPPRALLEAAAGDPVVRLPLLTRLMEHLRQHDETAYLARSRELAFLANTLQAGCSLQSRAFTPPEAADAAACTCNLGLESWTRELGAPALPDAFLAEHDLVAVFDAGWSALYQDVSLFAVDRLMAALADLRGPDADTDRELRALHRQLVTQRGAGTPWLARDAAGVLASFDLTAWIGVLGLLDECPILPEALTAVLQRRTTSVSPTAFQFISTAAQIGDIRVFMSALPRVLSC